MFEKYALRYSLPARLIWMGSLEGQPCWYDHDDWQLVKTDHSYEASKYEIDLIASTLNQRSLLPGGESKIVRHFVVHPGILHSNMTNGMVYAFFDTLKIVLFYIVSKRFPPTASKPVVTHKFTLGPVARLTKPYHHTLRCGCVRNAPRPRLTHGDPHKPAGFRPSTTRSERPPTLALGRQHANAGPL